MSCDKCYDIRKDIRVPKDLTEAIVRVRTKIEDGTLKYLGYGAFGDPFSRIAKGSGWGDFVNNYFACKSCGQIINLQAETYHGSGGRLAPISSIGERLHIDEFAT